MRDSFPRPTQAFLFVALALLVDSVAQPAIAQENKVAQVNGVGNSKMGPYRVPAQHIYGHFQKGNIAAAAAMAGCWKEYGTKQKTMEATRRVPKPITSCSKRSIRPWMTS